jgi:hypothetical protein
MLWLVNGPPKRTNPSQKVRVKRKSSPACEDMPYGLAFNQALGAIAGVPTAATRIIPEASSLLVGRDGQRAHAAVALPSDAELSRELPELDEPFARKRTAFARNSRRRSAGRSRRTASSLKSSLGTDRQRAEYAVHDGDITSNSSAWPETD